MAPSPFWQRRGDSCLDTPSASTDPNIIPAVQIKPML
uniref:Uncharacterized protein n=1 Tax=Arundo donax TaxID=35708 RepID=A0A0A8XSY0_ARUDO